MELTRERLAELRRIAEAATPGPWIMDPERRYAVRSHWEPPKGGVVGYEVCKITGNGPQHQADWEYIAAFHPEIAKALLDEIERLRVVLQYVADAPTRVQAWLRAHGIVFEDLDDPWQRAGFGLYNEISKAKAVLDEGEQAAGTKPDAAACQADELTGGGGVE